VENETASNLQGWMNGGPNTLGVVAFQQDILARVSQTISNVISMHGQGIIIWDITGGGSTNITLGSQSYLGDPRFLSPAASGLTVHSAFGPYVPPTSALGLDGLEPAIDAIADQVFAAIRSAGLTCGVALRAQKVNVDSNGRLVPIPGSGEAQYDTVSAQLADQDAKLTYAYKRWGCRLFYVDSNQASRDVTPVLQAQALPTWAPAWAYTQLYLRHPDCVLFPEEHYDGAFHFSGPPVINDPSYQYESVASRYTELRNPWQGPFLDSGELSAVPDAFTLIDVDNVGSSDPADTPNVIAALKNRQCILMADSWYSSWGVGLVINWQTAAGVNGF
jgi:hypothetical protein